MPIPQPKSIQVSLGQGVQAGVALVMQTDQAGLAGEGEQAAGQGTANIGSGLV